MNTTERTARRQYLEDVQVPPLREAPTAPGTVPATPASVVTDIYRHPSSESDLTVVDCTQPYPPYPSSYPHESDGAGPPADPNRQYLHGKDISYPPSHPHSSSRRFVPPPRIRSKHGMLGMVPDISIERAFFYALWIISQLLCFVPIFVFYLTTPKYTTARNAMGPTLALSRAAAMAINFDASFILLLVSRNFLSFLRSTFVSQYLTIDKNIHAHKLVAYSIAFWTLVHAAGHYVNMTNLVNRTKPEGTNVGKLLFLSPAGATGHILALILIIIFVTARAKIRRLRFELFYYTHHLFILFYILLLMHGAFCMVKADSGPQCGGRPDYWKFFLVPALVYTAERISREVRGRQPTQISRVVQHPSRVVQVQIKKPSVRVKTGQYVFINCPEIAPGQWHPFTLTSAPEDDYISVHIRMAGDWTRQFAERLGCNLNGKGGEPTKRFNPLRHKTLRRPNRGASGPARASEPANDASQASKSHTNAILQSKGLPRIMVDGPFGAPTEHVFDYEVALLVGAGIGVTPFASVLKSLWYRVTHPGKLNKLVKVYFVWICRDIQAFEWFQDLLVALEQEELGDFLEIRAYLTGKLSEDQIRNLAIHSTEDGPDALTGRKTPTYFGRPNFDQIFAEVAAVQTNKKVGVFFCGPKPVANTLRRVCNRFSADKENELGTGTTFVFHKEHF